MSKAAFFRRTVVDQLIPTEFLFKLFRIEESFPQREALSGAPLLGSSLEIVLCGGFKNTI